ncbi:MAG TPA: hypothetical protein VN200_07000 [Rhodoglobus sp.]|nr:hypothetical protein [Rhodoglobus sp.]
MVRRALVLGLVLITMSLALLTLQHRSAEGELHVVTAITATECAVDAPLPPPVAGEPLAASAGDLLPLVALLLVLPLAGWMLPRIRLRPPALAAPSFAALLPVAPLRV